jgi:hypothetical protein
VRARRSHSGTPGLDYNLKYDKSKVSFGNNNVSTSKEIDNGPMIELVLGKHQPRIEGWNSSEKNYDEEVEPPVSTSNLYFFK